MAEKRNPYRLLVGKPEWKKPLGRPRRRRVDNVRMEFGEVGLGDVEISCKFGIDPSCSKNSGKLFSGLTTGGLSSRAQLHRVS
jgi:hypothetical protein